MNIKEWEIKNIHLSKDSENSFCLFSFKFETNEQQTQNKLELVICSFNGQNKSIGKNTFF